MRKVRGYGKTVSGLADSACWERKALLRLAKRHGFGPGDKVFPVDLLALRGSRKVKLQDISFLLDDLNWTTGWGKYQPGNKGKNNLCRVEDYLRRVLGGEAMLYDSSPPDLVKDGKVRTLTRNEVFDAIEAVFR